MQRQPLSVRTAQLKFSSIREVVAKVSEARQKGIPIVDFSAGRPDFDTPRHIKEAAIIAMNTGLVHYAPSIGLIELREAICNRFYEDYKLQIDPEDVIITVGSTEAIHIGLQSILNVSDDVLVPQPMYVYYEGWCALGGAQIVTFPLREENEFSIKADDVKTCLTKRTKALILTSPHNPTGQVLEEKEMARIAELAIKKDFYVICDDIYQYFLYEGARHVPVASFPGMKERTLIVGSMSKSYAMDGWRIGYLIAPRHVISNALRMHQYTVNCCNTFVQYAATAALSGPQDCVREMIEEFDRRRILLLSCLDDLGFSYVRPHGAFYVFPSIRKFGLTSREFCDFLIREARVAAVPGDAFGPGGEGFIRMAYCLPCDAIERGMESVRGALKKL
jgi:aminotransferase